MPKGPRGEKRPGDVIGAAIMVARIATGELKDNGAAGAGGEARREGGRKGGAARARALTPRERSEIASAAASTRWKIS